MQRWKVSVLLFSCVSGLLIGCVALYLHGERGEESIDDLPLHPAAALNPSTSRGAHTVANHPPHNIHRHDHIHRYDALKGVFRSHYKGPPSEKGESSENNSRLKRQLDFNSDEEKKEGTTPKPNKVPPTNQPLLKVIKLKAPFKTSSPPSAPSSTSTERDDDDDDNDSEERGRGYPQKGFRKFRPGLSKNFRDSEEIPEIPDIPEKDRKNFTLEVELVERKVVRSEDSHIPRVYTKTNLNVVDHANVKKPSVVYKKGFNKLPPGTKKPFKQPPPIPTESSSVEADDYSGGDDRDDSQEKRVVINLNEQLAVGDQADLSDEDLKDYHDGHMTFGTKGNSTHSVISRNVAGFIPNSESAQQGEGGSALRKRKINISSSPQSRRYDDDSNERRGSFERGSNNRYPSPKSPFKDPSSEIYSVPGGRGRGDLSDNEKQKVYKYKPLDDLKPKGKADSDRTSPAISTSLEDLYRKGHPGVLPPPRVPSTKRNQQSRPFGNSGYGSPFGSNPLVDEIPLKFDPESDRFYGEPVPVNNERVAQSNSPIRAEDRNDDSSRDIEYQDYFKPKPQPTKRGRSAEPEEGAEVEDDNSSSVERPRSSNSREFDYGRVYNPTDFDNNDYNDNNQGDSQNNEPEYDFVGLEENFGPSSANDDYYDYGGGGAGTASPGGGDAGYRSRSGNRPPAEGDQGGDGNNNSAEGDEQATEGQGDDRPSPASDRNDGVEYDDNAGREAQEGPFGFGPPHGSPDDGFVETLKQFDDEIRKLQEQERTKLLHSPQSPGPPSSQSIGNNPGGGGGVTNGYKNKEPPLIITSPGPPVPAFSPPPAPPPNHDGDDDIIHTSPPQHDHPPEATSTELNASGSGEGGGTKDYDDSGSGSTEQSQNNGEGDDENKRRKRRKLYDIWK